MTVLLHSIRLNPRILAPALVGLLLTAGSVAAAQPASADGKQPPGANGSIKIDGQPFDSGPRNEPHVGCEFAVQFFGFDTGSNAVVNTFYAWPPTGDKSELEPTTGKTAFDFEGGRPPGNTLNHTEKYALDTSDLEPNKKGEIHVKLDVKVTDAGGKVAFHKKKVFWIEACSADSPSPSPEPTVATPTPTPTGEPTTEPTPTPTMEPTAGPTSEETPAPTTAPTSPSTSAPVPGPTAFDGGASGGASSSGPSGLTGAAGWIAVLVGLSAAGFGLTRMLRPARARSSATDA